MSLSLGRDGWLESVQQKCAGLRGWSVVRRGAEQAVGASKASASRQDERGQELLVPSVLHPGVPASWKHVSL